MIATYYRWKIGNTINQAKELPEGITDFEEIEIDETPIEIIEIPQTISPAEFYYGLILQDVTDLEVLDFIDNHIEDSEMQIKARILFTKATEFEYNNPILNAFIGGFNAYLSDKSIIFDDIFINGIKLNK